MKENIILICSDENKGSIVEKIGLKVGFKVRMFPDIGAMVNGGSPNRGSLLLLDLDSVAVDTASLQRLNRYLAGSKLIGMSVRNYHPDLKESFQSGVFTALVKPPFEEELTYWINSLMGSGDMARPGHMESQFERR